MTDDLKAHAGDGRPAPQVGRLLFIPGANAEASFVAADREALLDLAPSTVELRPGVGLRARLAFAAALRRLLTAEDVRLVVLWFAAPGYGPIVARAAKVRRVPLLVMAGGAEVADCPGLDFGDARRWWRRALVSRVLSGAAAVWAFSDSAAAEVSRVAPAARVAVVPPAVDTPFFSPVNATVREPLVVTACATITRVTVRQKGLDRLAAAARRRSDLRFVIVGRPDERDAFVRAFVESAPANVLFAGGVARTAVRDWLARAHVYAQLSGHEGFGVAVAEAMAMGCVPVITDLPALRATACERGVIVRREADDGEVAGAIDRALGLNAAPDQWSLIDSRFGPHVRRAAWVRELARRGFQPGR